MLRKNRPPGVRLATAASKADAPSFADRRAHCWFRCARVDTHTVRTRQGGEASEIVYPTHMPWQKDLARVFGYEGDIDLFQPREVPIVLLGPDPMEWFDVHLACWAARCTGRHMLGESYRLKSEDELRQEDQQRAMEMQAIDPSDKEQAEMFVGTASRRERGKGSRLITCDPLLCPYFGNPDPKQTCKPTVDLAFTVTWATGETAGSYYSQAWGSASRLLTTIQDLQGQLAAFNSTIAGAPCLLKVDPRPVTYDGGKTGTQPAVSISLACSLDELAERARNLMALGGVAVETKALPESPMTFRKTMETPAGRRGLMHEFTPEAYDAQMTAETAFRERWSGRLSEAAIEDLLHRFDSDLDGADAAAQTMAARKPQAQAEQDPEEEPIEAEFEAETDAEEPGEPVDESAEMDALKQQYLDAVKDVPRDVQRAWFAEVGAAYGELPTLEQLRGLMDRATGRNR